MCIFARLIIRHRGAAAKDRANSQLVVYQLLHCSYFNKHDKLIAIDLNKQRDFDADPKILKQIDFIGTSIMVQVQL